jgi:Tfp pilus assembly protein PilF
MPTAAHFLYIPGVLLLGIVIGWILGSRAAADAYAAQLRKLQPRTPRAANSQPPTPNSQ